MSVCQDAHLCAVPVADTLTASSDTAARKIVVELAFDRDPPDVAAGGSQSG